LDALGIAHALNLSVFVPGCKTAKE
jgi:hypothetical protein